MYEDKTLVCKECGQEFVFTAGEQEFYAERGFQNEPQRCKACRDARKQAARGPREYFTATCAACGGEARVPFEPKSDRPVYCSECFAKMREEGRLSFTAEPKKSAAIWQRTFITFIGDQGGEERIFPRYAALCRILIYGIIVKISTKWMRVHQTIREVRVSQHDQSLRKSPVLALCQR